DPIVREAIARAPSTAVSRYPGVYATDLKCAIAEYHGVAPDNVVTGCGSDDIIDSAIRAFADAGDAVAYPTPTFGMIPIFTRMNTCVPRPVALRDEFQLDVEAMLRTGGSINYVCNPNNPTGTPLNLNDILRLECEAAGITLLDEAYADYAAENFGARAVATEKLIVLRTFSKAFGLAGMRVGYALANATIAREIEKSRGPYKVGGIAESAALAVLTTGLARVRRSIEQTVENRERLAARLADLGFVVAPSAANFLLIAVPGAPAAAWAAALGRRDIGVRPFTGIPGMGDSIRVTVGPWPIMETFLSALRAIAAEFQATRSVGA
ncbi:MAG TPA: histidinol-phosphate transaminase, partial [Longimicrobiaceae bacterium]|nr:histidinol-phosphate transaminase [Longimicrobiaceae bacterium]